MNSLFMPTYTIFLNKYEVPEPNANYVDFFVNMSNQKIKDVCQYVKCMCKLIMLLTLALLSDWRNVAKRQDETIFRSLFDV
jgi:hypothetical protein